MIDIEPYVFDTVFKIVKAKFPEIEGASEYVDVVAEFPFFTLMETDNSNDSKTNDESLLEHSARLTYEANIYVSNESDAKALAKEIANTVDAAMQSLKFVRTFSHPTPNMDRTIHRITMQYTATIRETETGYQMYRQ